MRQKTNILLAATSFIGGLATGLLLAPKKGSRNRAWVTDHATELAYWADTQHKNAWRKGNSKLRRLRQNVQQQIRQNIPDLFDATENIYLSKSDIVVE